jgi:quercetin dioxygenase-like cupin family protein
VSARHIRFDRIAPLQTAPEITIQPVFGDQLTVITVQIGPGQAVPPHAHPQEQFSYVQRGLLTITVDGDAHEIGAGEAIIIPGGLEHAAAAGPEGATVLESFAPVRQDLRDRYEAAGLTARLNPGSGRRSRSRSWRRGSRGG